MNSKAQSFKSTILTYLVRENISEEKKIDDVIATLAKSPLFEDLSDEDILQVRKEIHSEYAITLDKGISIVNYDFKPWFINKKKDIDMKYWDRYRQYLINDKGFSVPTVNTMDIVSDELTDLLGDPNQHNFQRRGLIIGDVQSGKTANYSGLICKAADVGYKVIVLLTGTIEKLRSQTQKRIDESFTGRDSDAMLKQKENVYIGVGKYEKTLNAISFTSKSNDFKVRFAINFGSLALDSLSDPAIFVIKKNVKSLRTLNDWFKTQNLNSSSNKINKSLLMIDDESDNASINTNPEDKDPTKTNLLIVEMLGLFSRASYVGFTATPFANIFIDPDTDEEMENSNLFPRDYIYALNSPSNYIGARNIFPENAKYHNMLRVIEDGEQYYPLDHTKDSIFNELSPSLCDAINTFFLANTIRDLRNDIKTHRSMIINISRFVNCQSQIYDLVYNYVNEVQKSVKVYSKLEPNEALKNEIIANLKRIFELEYSNLEYSWNEILAKINESIAPVQVTVVNQRNNTLSYEDYEDDGLRVIAIGGLSLSRGLTLEGLIVSYFYRNSKMYDTLMQMGRWFGYRKNYDDLCRIWMSEENIEWYNYISEATDELRLEVKKMRDMKKTPLDFGLRVRSDIDGLLVTARNKMRTAKDFKRNISLSGEVVETPYLFDNELKNNSNYSSVMLLIHKLNDFGFTFGKDNQSNRYGYYNVSKEYIINLLDNVSFPLSNPKFNAESISKFINNYKGKELDKWDIVFVSGSSENKNIINGQEIPSNMRSYDLKQEAEENIIRIGGSKARLGNPGDPKFALKDADIEIAKNKFNEYHANSSSMSNKDYFIPEIKRNPLLMIYFVDLKEPSKYTTNVRRNLVGLGIGIPNLTDEETKFAIYKVNKTYFDLGQNDDYGDEE